MLELALDDNSDDREAMAKDVSQKDSFDERDSFAYVRFKDHDLHLIRKKDKKLVRPLIAASRFQRLTFYRYLSCTPLKQQRVFMQPNHFPQYVWQHVYSNIFEIMTHVYVILFLSQYTPHEHLYASKMVPLFWGCSLQVIMCSFMSMVVYSDNVCLVLDYAFLGLFFRTPWNRCKENIVGNVHCYILQTFHKMTSYNATLERDYHKNYFLYKLNTTLFRPSQLIHYTNRAELKTSSTLFSSKNFFWVYYWVVWISVTLFYRKFFRIRLWQVYNFLFWVLCLIYGITLITIEVLFYIQDIKKNVNFDFPDNLNKLQYERFSEILIAPPVIHLLHARSKSEVKPSRDSALFTVSAITFYIFQALVYLRLRHYCDGKAGVSITNDMNNSFPVFYLWPMFFGTLTLGPLCGKFFYIILFCLEYLTFVLSYQSLVEVITCEWGCIKWWMASILLSVSALAFKVIFDYEERLLLFIFGIGFTFMMEVIVIYLFYPVGRLIEDMHFFYYGNFITEYRRFTLFAAPMFLVLRLLHDMYKYFFLKKTQFVGLRSLIPFCVYFGPILMGFVYKLGWIAIKKMPCKSLVTPLNSWGPRDSVTRMFRKQFNEKKFIDSMANVYLSRHMLKKAEPPTYELGLQYED